MPLGLWLAGVLVVPLGGFVVLSWVAGLTGFGCVQFLNKFIKVSAPL